MTARRDNVTMGFVTGLGANRKPKTAALTAEDRTDIAALDAAADARERSELETVDHADLKRRLGLD